jgi:hypothetical protein
MASFDSDSNRGPPPGHARAPRGPARTPAGSTGAVDLAAWWTGLNYSIVCTNSPMLPRCP